MIDIFVVDIIFLLYAAICVVVTILLHVETKGDVPTRLALILGILWIPFVIFAAVIMYLHGFKPHIILLN